MEKVFIEIEMDSCWVSIAFIENIIDLKEKIIM